MSATLLFGAVGLIVGHVLNLLADYLPRFAANRRRTRIFPQTRCVLAVWQLATNLFSKGRPRLRGSLISNAAVELVTASLFSYLWLRFGLSWNLLVIGLVGSFLILIALIDLKYRLILNVLVLPAALVTIVLTLTSGDLNLLRTLMGGGFGLAVFAFAAIVRPGQLGGGDVKLAAFIGLMFGFPNAIMPLLLGILAGGIAAFLLILTRRGNRSTQIPYAPFLCMGALIALLYFPHVPFSVPL